MALSPGFVRFAARRKQARDVASTEVKRTLAVRGEGGSIMPATSNGFPNKGDRVEQLHTGIRRVGRVWYVDDLQVLVKWEDGGSSSLRIGRDRFRPAA